MIEFNFLKEHGVITFNDFNISSDKPLLSQIDELKEDMLQVEFPNQYLLDIGWFPSFNVDGNFQVRLIKDFNWEKPLFFNAIENLTDLNKTIKKAISLLPIYPTQS